MSFYVENETEFEFDFDLKMLLSDLTKETLKVIGCPFNEVSVNLSICDDEEIQRVNAEFREIDKSTDVLSFPTIDFETEGDFSKVSEDDLEYFDPDSNELLLGDILISIDHAKKQAEEYGHSLKREIAFLITHSLLHLCGFDHVDDEERRIRMEEKQTIILNNLKITRD